MFHALKLIAKNHFLYIVCSVIYFFISAKFWSFLVILFYIFIGTSHNGNLKLSDYFIAFIFYVISLCIALSPLGEKLLRFMNGIRKLETKEEKEYLLPLFNNVRNSFKKKCRKHDILDNIDIFVIDNIHISACAVGRRTIAVSKGAMKAFDEEQLKGVIAHEMAHIYYCDTIASVFLMIANGLFFIFIFVLNWLIKMIDKENDKSMTENQEKKSGRFFQRIFQSILFVFTLLMNITIAIESKKSEYKADDVAYVIGYGKGITEALYLLEKISLGDNRNFIQKMTASHPRITARIEKLESSAEEQRKKQKQVKPTPTKK